MDWLNKIQNKSHAEKMRIIWIVAATVAGALVIVWIISTKYYRRADKDTTLFKTLEQGVKDVRENFKKN